MADNKEIGHRIEARRKSLNLTLDDVASSVGVTKSTIQRYEKGKITKLKLPVIEAIASTLSVNPSWLCCKTDNMELILRQNDTRKKEAGPPEGEPAMLLQKPYMKEIVEVLDRLTPESLEVILAQIRAVGDLQSNAKK